jgi:hypothetical protein
MFGVEGGRCLLFFLALFVDECSLQLIESKVRLRTKKGAPFM